MSRPGGDIPRADPGRDDVAWPALDLSAHQMADVAAMNELEWIETNGLGGYALQGVLRPLQRRYSGLLVAAIRPPVERQVVVARFEEYLECGGVRHRLWEDRREAPAAAAGVPLDRAAGPPAPAPDAYAPPVEFRRYPFPRHAWRIGACRLHRTVVMRQDANTTLVRYTLVEASGPVLLTLEPLCAFRDHHDTRRATAAWPLAASDDGQWLTVRPVGEAAGGAERPALRLGHAGGSFVAAPAWAMGYVHDIETERGLDDVDDYPVPGRIEYRLAPGQSIDVILTLAGDPATPPPPAPDMIVADELARRAALLAPVAGASEPIRRLRLAADQFLVRRGRERRSIIAGYPWFTDWGRDTMIALPGLCLATGRLAEAGDILATFAAHVKDGLLPNHFPDDGEAPHYNTVDASLWFFQAIRQFRAAGGALAAVRRDLYPAAREIVGRYVSGTHFNIRADQDDLIGWDAAGQALTWMDARVDDHAFTPRRGRPVEIQALWHAALLELAELAALFDEPALAADARARAARVKAAFNRLFWNAERGYLHDVLTAGGPDPALRPNALFALSLPGDLVPRERAQAILATARRALVTPVGLRSLAAGEPGYVGRMIGDRVARDTAYHQGTVWGWLLGPYLEALWRSADDRAAARAEIRARLDAAAAHLADDGLGTFAEVFDGDQPHHPRGCLAQAWSVAELLRIHALLDAAGG